MNSGRPGGICTLPLLCEIFLGEPPLGGGKTPCPPSAYAPGDRETDRQIDNLVEKGPLRVLRTLHSSLQTVNSTTTCERLRHICINPERFNVHPAILFDETFHQTVHD